MCSFAVVFKWSGCSFEAPLLYTPLWLWDLGKQCESIKERKGRKESNISDAQWGKYHVAGHVFTRSDLRGKGLSKTLVLETNRSLCTTGPSQNIILVSILLAKWINWGHDLGLIEHTMHAVHGRVDGRLWYWIYDCPTQNTIHHGGDTNGGSVNTLECK